MASDHQPQSNFDGMNAKREGHASQRDGHANQGEVHSEHQREGRAAQRDGHANQSDERSEEQREDHAARRGSHGKRQKRRLPSGKGRGTKAGRSTGKVDQQKSTRQGSKVRRDLTDIRDDAEEIFEKAKSLLDESNDEPKVESTDPATRRKQTERAWNKARGLYQSDRWWPKVAEPQISALSDALRSAYERAFDCDNPPIADFIVDGDEGPLPAAELLARRKAGELASLPHAHLLSKVAATIQQGGDGPFSAEARALARVLELERERGQIQRQLTEEVNRRIAAESRVESTEREAQARCERLEALVRDSQAREKAAERERASALEKARQAGEEATVAQPTADGDRHVEDLLVAGSRLDLELAQMLGEPWYRRLWRASTNLRELAAISAPFREKRPKSQSASASTTTSSPAPRLVDPPRVTAGSTLTIAVTKPAPMSRTTSEAAPTSGPATTRRKP